MYTKEESTLLLPEGSFEVVNVRRCCGGVSKGALLHIELSNNHLVERPRGKCSKRSSEGSDLSAFDSKAVTKYSS